MGTMRRTTAALILCALLTACSHGDDGTPSASPSTGTTPPPATSTSAAPTSTCPSQPDPGARTVITATVAAGKVTTAHAQWSVKVGTQVRVAVTADVADEVHVHGYDLKQDTTVGCPTAIDFTANIPGSVEVELEDAGLTLFEIKAS